jgi:hypothetical protein
VKDLRLGHFNPKYPAMIAVAALVTMALPSRAQRQGPVEPQAPTGAPQAPAGNSQASPVEPPGADGEPQLRGVTPQALPGTPARAEDPNREKEPLSGLSSWMDRMAVGASEEYAAPPILPSSLPEKIAIPAGTRIPIVLETSLSSRFSHQGQAVSFRTTSPVLLGEELEIPPGVVLQGRLAEVTRSSAFGRSGRLRVTVERMILPGAPAAILRAQLRSADVVARGRLSSDGHRSVDRRGLAVVSLQGALAGAQFGGKAAAMGAGAGVALVAVLMMSQRGSDVSVSAGTPFSVRLQQDVYLPAPAVFWAQQDYASSHTNPSADEDSGSDADDGPRPVLKRRGPNLQQP